jgi:hypothetical protein
MKGSNPLRVSLIVMAAMMLMAVAVPCAEAFTKPVAGSFAYDIYTIGITNLLKGPAGFVGAAILVVIGIVMLLRGQWAVTVGSFLSAGIMAKAETILTSLGANI